jgi:Xaa-Pro aminopeptidase
MTTLVSEKVEQAVAVLDELGIDAWLTFVRETTEAGDPVLPIILGQPLTWQSALLLTRRGDRIAIVGRYEDEAVRSTGAWTDVVPYVEGIREPLRAALARIDPGRLAVNYSTGDVKADGLTHGLFLVLQDILEGTPWGERLVSAEAIIGAIRGRKTAGELARLRAAIDTTDEILRDLAAWAEPGATEAAVSAFMHEGAARRGVELAWESAMCPIVTTGPDSMVGHGLPSSDLRITPGRIFHVDFGVRRDEYCSDVQRAWYVPSDAAPDPPPGLARVFDTVRRAIEAAAAVLRPGAEGWTVDAAARAVVVEAGYPEYRHATGHQVGRAAHDGGCVLGPRWERYGDTPTRRVEPGNVFTLELGVEETDGAGYLGLEEMLVVTESGCEPLTTPQRSLPALGGPAPARLC